jgi:BRCT domain type II-containing protein
VDKVLLPLDIFVPKAPPAPAPAPLPVKPKAKKAAASPKSSSTTTPSTPTLVVDSGAVSLTKHGILVSVGVSVFIAAFSL